MSTPTRPTFERLAFVFDYDGTLAGDSYDAILRQMGEDPATFRKERLEPLVEEGWEGSLARLFLLQELRVTEDDLREAGRALELMPGVEEIFDAIRERARDRIEDVEVEFYVVSAGIRTILEESPITDELKRLWACELTFDDDGVVTASRKVVTHEEKANYLLQIARGLDEVQGNPPDPYQPIGEEELHVPIDHMVYVGDGKSDMPAFALIADRHGIALALNKEGEWDEEDDSDALHRVDAILEPDYREGQPLHEALLLATDAITARIAIRGLGQSD